MRTPSSDALRRKILHSFRPRPEWQLVWEEMEKEYRRTAKHPAENTIGMLADMAAECWVTWKGRPDACG